MSKSLGNVIAPQKISETLGAEVLRLWAAATDYSGELFISDEILKRVVETYRRIRNTLRFLLANTSDFDPKRDALPVEQWVEIDRYAVALAGELQRSVGEDYGRYEFHLAVSKLQTFCSEDLGSFYLDVLKDRLYTTAASSPARRSAQNALYHLTHGLLRLMAPVLSFTAEEAWKVFQPGGDTVFAQTTYRFPEVPGSESLLAKWRSLRDFRSSAEALEQHRAAGEIGSSLRPRWISLRRGRGSVLRTLGDELRFVLVTSRAGVTTAASPAEAIRAPSKHAKCELLALRADVEPNRSTRESAGAACRSCPARELRRLHERRSASFPGSRSPR
jgi:isoleucyl-tRNA synthetase